MIRSFFARKSLTIRYNKLKRIEKVVARKYVEALKAVLEISIEKKLGKEK